MTQNLPFPQITSTAGLAGLLHFKKTTKKNNSLIWFFSLFSLLTSIVWDRQSELGLFLGGWVELHAGRWEGGAGCCYRRNCGARGAVDVCSQLPSYKTHICTQHASSFFESLSLSLCMYVCACVSVCTAHMNGLSSTFEGTCMTLQICVGLAVHESEQWLRYS